MESGILGAGNASYRLRDTTRQSLLTTLHYVANTTQRQLIPTRPNVSLSGLQSPEGAGWSANPGNNTAAPFVRGQTLELSKTSTQTAQWSQNADFGTLVDDEGLILESRFSVQSHTSGTRGIGIAIGGSCALASTGFRRIVYLTLGTGTVDLRDSAYAVVQSFAFAWDDGGFHAYRLLCDPVADIVVLVIDDAIVGSTPFAGFAPDATTTYLTAALELTGDGACAVTLDSMSATPLRVVARIIGGIPQVIDRTFGVYLRRTPTGGDPSVDDINSYRIPRLDGTNALNSSLFATAVPMDWTAFCRVPARSPAASGCSWHGAPLGDNGPGSGVDQCRVRGSPCLREPTRFRCLWRTRLSGDFSNPVGLGSVSDQRSTGRLRPRSAEHGPQPGLHAVQW